VSASAQVEVGWVSAEVAQELPGLRVLSREVAVARQTPLTGRSPPEIESRMREMSSRFRGARAISLRREAIPAAYRVFFRHIGLDPDVARPPIEAAVLERMLRGAFLTGGLLDDVLLIALLDTSVPVWALDADSVHGPLGIRTSREAEALGRSPDPPRLPEGRLVVADSHAALAILFEAVTAPHAAGPKTSRLVLFAIQVEGVPTLFAEEALWSCASALEQP
jgi:DNA/RNA-binding domain of Phe-tRNA-synthetase-like protein